MKLSSVIYNVITGDWGSDVYSEQSPCGVHCIRSADIVPYYNSVFDGIPIRYISKNSFNTRQLHEGDIVIEKSGGTNDCSTGRTMYVSKELLEANPLLVCSNFCAAFRVKEGWDSRFIYYFLRLVHSKGIFHNFEGKTSGIHNLQMEAAFDVIDLPSLTLEEQKKAANLLSDIDSKLANNRKQNDILEKIAKQIYDYWFVQFDFPDENGRPYKSFGGKMVWNEKLKREIPQGWELHCLEELGNFKNGINYSKDEVGDRQYKIVNVRNISSSSIFIDNSDLDELTLKCSNGDKYLVKDSDILIARSGTPGATRLIRDIDDNVIYCGFIICYTLNDLDDKPFLFYSIKQLEGVTQAQSNGSILSNISQDVLKQLLVSMPPTKIKLMFNEKVKTIFASIQNGLREIESLSKQRDKLLPLLMTGQAKLK